MGSRSVAGDSPTSARVRSSSSPRRSRPESSWLVVHFGCGPAQPTAEPARRWPGAEVRGLDAPRPVLIAAASLVDAAGSWAQLRPGPTCGTGGPSPISPPPSPTRRSSGSPGHEALLPGSVQVLSPGGWWRFRSR